MSTSPSNLGNDSGGSLSPGFNVNTQPEDPLASFQMLQNWAPQAMEAIRRSNIKTQMKNPQATVESGDQAPAQAKGILSSLL